MVATSCSRATTRCSCPTTPTMRRTYTFGIADANDGLGAIIEGITLPAGVIADGGSIRPSISSDGRYITFASEATNLVAGDTNGLPDTFIYDRQTDTFQRVSVARDGTQGDGDSSLASDVSSNGNIVVFSGTASNLVPGRQQRRLGRVHRRPLRRHRRSCRRRRKRNGRQHDQHPEHARRVRILGCGSVRYPFGASDGRADHRRAHWLHGAGRRLWDVPGVCGRECGRRGPERSDRLEF